MKVSQLEPAARNQQIQQHEQKNVKNGKRTATSKEQQSKNFTEQEVTTPEQLAKAVEQANTTMESFQTNLHFKMHEKSGEYIVQVINSESKEVIREIPAEKILDMVAHFKKMVGIMVDEIV